MYIYIFFLAVLGLNSGPHTWLNRHSYRLSHSTSSFLWWVFFVKIESRTICPGWFWTMILLISASWVARITGVSPQRPTRQCILNSKTVSQVGLRSQSQAVLCAEGWRDDHIKKTWTAHLSTGKRVSLAHWKLTSHVWYNFCFLRLHYILDFLEHSSSLLF
jgi:hypothetical protein